MESTDTYSTTSLSSVLIFFSISFLPFRCLLIVKKAEALCPEPQFRVMEEDCCCALTGKFKGAAAWVARQTLQIHPRRVVHTRRVASLCSYKEFEDNSLAPVIC